MIDYRKLYSKYDKEDLVNTCVNLKQNKERLRKEVNRSYIACDEKDKEIERLNNIIKEKNKDFELLRKAQLKKCQEYEDLEKLNNANYQSFIEVNNIINELEKYINEEYIYDELGMKIFDASKLQDKLQELKGNNNGVWVNNLLEVIKENNIEFGSDKE